MRVILYMAVSNDGFIARPDGSTPWPKQEWVAYAKMVASVGNLVIGRKTFEIMSKGREFANLGNPFIVVVSKDFLNGSGVHHASSPKAAMRLLKDNGFDTLLLGGGSNLIASFLELDVIDEVYLDEEDVYFGAGIPLFSENVNLSLEEVEQKIISPTTIQKHFVVNR